MLPNAFRLHKAKTVAINNFVNKIMTLKNIFSNIKNHAFNNKLLSALNIQDILRKRILQKILNNWNEKAKKIGIKHSTEMIQKNWRIYLYKKKQENIFSIIFHHCNTGPHYRIFHSNIFF